MATKAGLPEVGAEELRTLLQARVPHQSPVANSSNAPRADDHAIHRQVFGSMMTDEQRTLLERTSVQYDRLSRQTLAVSSEDIDSPDTETESGLKDGAAGAKDRKSAHKWWALGHGDRNSRTSRASSAEGSPRSTGNKEPKSPRPPQGGDTSAAEKGKLARKLSGSVVM